MNIKENISQLIGSTPLVRLKNVEIAHGLDAQLLAKLEANNPAGSAKDRIALEMINAAEQEGFLPPGGTVIEPTSGNTGIGIAAICASRGYKAVIIMPNTMSIERCRLIKAYGAELILTPGEKGMQGAVDMAEEMHKNLPGSIIAGQFVNPANPAAHYKTTGPEIWSDTDGQVDVLVAGVGSGGTISGAGKYLKEKKPSVKIIAVEPADSPLISEGRAASHGIQGIGANFIPKNLDRNVLDEIICVDTQDAYAFGRELASKEGLLSGISSGAALAAAVQLAKRAEYRDKRIVVILPDTGERYLSSEMFQ